MRASKHILILGLAVLIVAGAAALPAQLIAQTGTEKSSSESPGSNTARWIVQVGKVDPGDVDLTSSFQIAIYENLLDELS